MGSAELGAVPCKVPRNARMTWQARPGKENARFRVEPGASAFRSVSRSDQDNAEKRSADRDGGDRREEGSCECTHRCSPVGWMPRLASGEGAYGAAQQVAQLRNIRQVLRNLHHI